MTLGIEIEKIISEEILQEPGLELDPNADLLTTGTLDSMALVRLVAKLESNYSIKIPPTDLVIEHFLNIHAIDQYITKRLSNQEADQ